MKFSGWEGWEGWVQGAELRVFGDLSEDLLLVHDVLELLEAHDLLLLEHLEREVLVVPLVTHQPHPPERPRPQRLVHFQVGHLDVLPTRWGVQGGGVHALVESSSAPRQQGLLSAGGNMWAGVMHSAMMCCHTSASAIHAWGGSPQTKCFGKQADLHAEVRIARALLDQLIGDGLCCFCALRREREHGEGLRAPTVSWFVACFRCGSWPGASARGSRALLAAAGAAGQGA